MLPLLALLALPPQLPANVCTLLKPADLSALGAATPHNSDMEVSEGPTKGQKVKGCVWQIGKTGMVAISISPVPADAAARQAGLAVIEQTYNQLKSQGWTEEKQEIPGGMCALLTPPASQKDDPNTTGCFTESKGFAVSVSAVGKTKVAIDQVKPLLDKVVQRLP